MRIVILGAPHSAHTVKWVKGLLGLGHHIKLIGFNDGSDSVYADIANLETTFIQLEFGNTSTIGSKLKWVQSIPKIKREIKGFNPDIVHAHYATSYGLLGALSHAQPLVISVWGSDVYEFPNRSFIHSLLLKYILSKANVVLATGNQLANETKKYTSVLSRVEVVPFGVDTELFKSNSDRNLNSNQLKVGVVKKLEVVYGISTLLKALAIFHKNNSTIEVKLQIVGSGGLEAQLKKESEELGINDLVEFKGYIENHLLPDVYDGLDVVVIPSLRESFGISVLEAMSMEVPVIASDVSGFREVGTKETITYFKPGNEDALAQTLQRFISNREEFSSKTSTARSRVEALYSERIALKLQEQTYLSLL